MGIERFFVTPITVLTAPLVSDAHNNQIRDWTHASSRSTKGWKSQTSGQEILDGRDAVITDAILYLPATDAIAPYDRVQADGTTYEVNGPINYARTPRGVHHIEVRLSAVDG